jgi:hypothetical protein
MVTIVISKEEVEGGLADVGSRFLGREQSGWLIANAKTSILLNDWKPAGGLL